MSTPNRATHELEQLLDMDLLSATAGAVHTKASNLSRTTVDRLLHSAQRILENRQSEETRVAAAKVLVGLVPESLGLIQEWFDLRREGAHEVHFSILCFLDEVPAMESSRPLGAVILAMVSRYLMNVKSEAAQAAWMAGDLLGDHWNLDDSLPALLNAAKHGRFVAGRLGALHGIEQAAEAASGDSDIRASIRSVVRELAKSDPSKRVRERAEQLLGAQC